MQRDMNHQDDNSLEPFGLKYDGIHGCSVFKEQNNYRFIEDFAITNLTLKNLSSSFFFRSISEE